MGLVDVLATEVLRRRVYRVKDGFTTLRAAGALNGTPADGVGGARVATDTGSKLSVGAGGLVIVQNSAYGNPGLWYGPQARALGLALLAQLTCDTATWMIGWDANQAGQLSEHFFFSGGNVQPTGAGFSGHNWPIAGATSYWVALILRPTGSHFLIKGGVYSQWKRIGGFAAGVNDPVYPGLTTYSGTATIRKLRVVRRPMYPVVGDGFGGVWGATDGLAAAEGGGGGEAWTDRLGVWSNTGGKAACGTLDGSGVGLATVDGPSADLSLNAKVTRAGGVAGLVVRYVDALNFVYAYHDGTNAKLQKVVDGLDTNVITSLKTYGAGSVLGLHCDGASFRLTYNNSAAGAAASISDEGLQAGVGCGLYTTHTGNQFDDLLGWPVGNGGEFAWLDRFTL